MELKELGDVGNWAQSLEELARDVNHVASRIASLTVGRSRPRDLDSVVEGRR
jgi:hypothetical protein